MILAHLCWLSHYSENGVIASVFKILLSQFIIKFKISYLSQNVIAETLSQAKSGMIPSQKYTVWDWDHWKPNLKGNSRPRKLTVQQMYNQDIMMFD